MRGEVSSVGSDQPLFSSPHPLSGTWETWMAPNVSQCHGCLKLSVEGLSGWNTYASPKLPDLFR